ncbi:GNAT family N-acetyltransferase [Plantibacter sp. YIM 135347]|uniref:GNAT family N-acetyltransferase n=1 Tax=Plantibacter sp. YIM 135347 TaxID=3423919 RepID=UPI003D354D4B
MVDYRIEHRNEAGAVERILRSLPAWFGIEGSLLEYVESARTQESYLVLAGDVVVVVGVGLVVRRFPESAEIELLAVHADHRGRGAGRVLIEAIVEAVTRDGIQLLSVHTVGPSYEDEAYAATRAF